MSSTYTQLSQAAYTVATGISQPQVNGVAVTVKRALVAQVRDALETLPALLICVGNGPESTRPFATGGYQDVSYLLQFLLVGAANRDPAVVDSVTDAREIYRKLFQRPTAIAPLVSGVQVLQTDVLPEAPLARAAWLRNYALSAFSVRFRVIEPAS